MEKVAKVLLILTMLLLVFSLDVEGGRQLKISKEQIDRPQTFFGNGGTGGVRGFIPSPGLAGELVLGLAHQAFVLSSQQAVPQFCPLSLVFPLVLAHHHEILKDLV